MKYPRERFSYSRLLWGGTIILLSLPLLSIEPWFAPPSFGKVVVFRTVMGVLLFFVLWGVLWRGVRLEVRPFFRPSYPLFWPLLFFFVWLGSALLATATSIDPANSFWGSPVRGWGVLNLFFYAAFALLLFLFLQDKHWQKLWNLTLAIAALAALLGIIQYLQSAEAITRPYSAFGNAGIFALYLTMVWFAGLALFFQTKSTRQRLWYGTALIGMALAILLTLTRAAFLALGIGAVIFFLAYPSPRRWPKILALALLGGGLSMLLLATVFPQAPFPASQPFWNRLSLKNAQESSRMAVWDNALLAIRERPFLGYGPYNSYIAFNRFYDPADPHLQGTKWWDTFHNIFLDAAISIGLIGSAFWLAFLGTLLYRLQKAKNEGRYALAAHGVQISLIAYLIGMTFFFDVFSTYLIFFLLVGYSFFLIKKHSQSA